MYYCLLDFSTVTSMEDTETTVTVECWYSATRARTVEPITFMSDQSQRAYLWALPFQILWLCNTHSWQNHLENYRMGWCQIVVSQTTHLSVADEVDTAFTDLGYCYYWAYWMLKTKALLFEFSDVFRFEKVCCTSAKIVQKSHVQVLLV